MLTFPPRWASAIGCSLTAALVVGGCGESSAGARRPPAPSASVEVALTEYRFAPNPIDAPAGRTTFRLTNDGRTGHDFTIISGDGHRRLARSPLIGPGNAATLTVDLRAGTYEVICTQPGHQEAGMEAVLQVSAPAQRLASIPASPYAPVGSEIGRSSMTASPAWTARRRS